MNCLGPEEIAELEFEPWSLDSKVHCNHGFVSVAFRELTLLFSLDPKSSVRKKGSQDRTQHPAHHSCECCDQDQGYGGSHRAWDRAL